jgi:hypothetical protein
MKVEEKQNPSIFLATYCNLALKSGDLGKKKFFKIWQIFRLFFPPKKSFVLVEIIFFRLKVDKNSRVKETPREP